MELQRAEIEQWAALFKGADQIHRSGEAPARPAAIIQPYVGGERVWGRDISRGARAITGKQSAFEVAVFSPADSSHPQATTECSGCGVSVTDVCPFCHAQWGMAAHQEPLDQINPDESGVLTPQRMEAEAR
ncbi:hypothetical protein [Ornithinimicrobium sp. Y1694]|uniref:hypothetical protein n=1 Tax=Ornithinimicrobium sp. Y1694 TaxID=3418590 RepID=UPI003CEFC4C7